MGRVAHVQLDGGVAPDLKARTDLLVLGAVDLADTQALGLGLRCQVFPHWRQVLAVPTPVELVHTVNECMGGFDY